MVGAPFSGLPCVCEEDIPACPNLSIGASYTGDIYYECVFILRDISGFGFPFSFPSKKTKKGFPRKRTHHMMDTCLEPNMAAIRSLESPVKAWSCCWPCTWLPGSLASQTAEKEAAFGGHKSERGRPEICFWIGLKPIVLGPQLGANFYRFLFGGGFPY